MKKITVKMMVVAAVGIAIFWACKPEADLADEYLPQDVLASCTVSESEFDSWFVDGKATENGIVKAANSITFGHQNNCDFYKWSHQMFLWLTSNSGKDFQDGKRVFESPEFYTVSPEFQVIQGKDTLTQRNLIPHAKNKLLSAMPFLEKSFGVDSEEGQATGDALMSKDSAMVYYITMVNDVYAAFLTANKNSYMKSTQFPTTQASLDSIQTYAKQHNMPLPNPQALAMEIKTSWVDASTIKDQSSYIIIDALIPTYTKNAANTTWTLKGQVKVKLAMIGMHIVGSTAGHPEMVWSTFEHKNNAPNIDYTYLDKNSKVVTRKADTGNDWLLNSDVKSQTYNVSHMTYSSDSTAINANSGMTISPSNTKRTKPWGVANAGVPNPENATVAAANSQVISINNSVIGLLKGNDIRKNYLFIGSTWTSGGAAPDGSSYATNNTQAGTAIGSSQLANSTMETYIQNDSVYNHDGSCFTCHHDYVTKPKPTLLPDYLSHVYNDLNPLPVTAPDGKLFNRKIINVRTEPTTAKRT